MTKARAAKKLAQAAAFGGGGLGLIGATLYGVLTAEARYAKHVIGPMKAHPAKGDGLYGRYPGHPITLAMIGDSSAAGYGTSSPDETPGVLLACGLAELAKRPVRLVDVSRTGAKSNDLAYQVDTALLAGPHVAAILIGVNDVKSQMPPSTSVRLLDGAVRRLRAANCEVVVGTCPDLGVVRPIMPPLRQVARSWSQRLAAAQTISVVEAAWPYGVDGLAAERGIPDQPVDVGPGQLPPVSDRVRRCRGRPAALGRRRRRGRPGVLRAPRVVPGRGRSADRRGRRPGRPHGRYRGGRRQGRG